MFPYVSIYITPLSPPTPLTTPPQTPTHTQGANFVLRNCEHCCCLFSFKVWCSPRAACAVMSAVPDVAPTCHAYADDDQLRYPIRGLRDWIYHHRGHLVQNRGDAYLQEAVDANGRSCLQYSWYEIQRGTNRIQRVQSGYNGLCHWHPSGHTFRTMFRYFGQSSNIMLVCWFTRFGWLREHLPGGANCAASDGSNLGPIGDDDFVMTSRDVFEPGLPMRELPLDGHRVVLRKPPPRSRPPDVDERCTSCGASSESLSASSESSSSCQTSSQASSESSSWQLVPGA